MRGFSFHSPLRTATRITIRIRIGSRSIATRRDHIAFGGGIHRCLGAGLAELEGRWCSSRWSSEPTSSRSPVKSFERANPTLRGAKKLPVEHGGMAMRPPTRRTQEERSTATRERLLDATIECLDRARVRRDDDERDRPAGRCVARCAGAPLPDEGRAGPERHRASGAQAPVQELKAEFEQLNARDDRVSGAIDLLWSAYAGPLFAAALELIVAARTDRSARPALERAARPISLAAIERFCRETFGRSRARRRSATSSS